MQESIKTQTEIVLSTYTDEDKQWYYVYEQDLQKIIRHLTIYEEKLHNNNDDMAVIEFLVKYKEAINKKLIEVLSDIQINHGRALYYTAILTLLKEYHGV